MSEEKAPVAAEEKEPDNDLVEQAYQKLTEITTRRASQTMHEVGEYLIKTFYDDNVEYAQSRTPVKEKSINQLFSKIRKDSDAYSKSWFYNSIHLAADQRYFNNEGFTTYDKLGVSQKIYLAHIKDVEIKRALIEEAVENKYPVSKLKKRIAEEQGKVTTTLASIPEKDKLKEWSVEYLKKVQEKGEKDIKELNSRISRYKKNQENLQEVIKEKEEA